ncbi:MAG TPA: ThiF family adenylyltransferase, partial [Solirubrobacterales bacterium]|nr:ThiF family adenylyltransferase [Solirubrobacterales bacterium]
LDLGRFNLAGVGAVGQAAAHTLAACGAKGTLAAIDHETITLSNLQRYVLARDSDIGTVKVKLLKKRLSSEALEIVPHRSKWDVGRASKGIPTLVAFDTAQARIELQAALPGPIYNAWTQPSDVGFSRHEAFGEEPCLACLHWPTQSRPSRYEQIAAAFNQHPARCLSYLVLRSLPAGVPLPPGAVQTLPGIPNPPDAEEWTQRPILDDIVEAAGLEASELTAWRERSLADLYQDGVCGGAILDLGVGEAPREALVPLAHQSAFAGIMLATQLLAASDPALREARPQHIEGRYDLLSGGPQQLPRPRARTPGCICSDDVYREVYVEKFTVSEESGET